MSRNTPTPSPEELRQMTIFQLRVLCAGLAIYRLHVGRFPDGVEGIAALWTPPADDLARESWRGPYVVNEDLALDPWGRLFAYGPVDSEGMYDLRSLGPDGIVSSDDIVAAEVMPEFFAQFREELARFTPGPTLPTRQK